MTTATQPTTPLESYQQGRDRFLSVVLDAVHNLETNVLAYEGDHDRQHRTTAAQLQEALREKAWFERLAGEQAEELSGLRAHVPVPAPAPVDWKNAAGEAGQAEAEPVDAPVAADDTVREDLAEAERQLAELRGELAGKDREIAALKGELAAAQRSAEEANDQAAADGASVEDRLREGVRHAEAAARTEAVRILNAITADNPALAEAAELFAVAYSTEPSAGEPASVEPAAEPAVPAGGQMPIEDAMAEMLATVSGPDWDGAPTLAAPTLEAPPEFFVDQDSSPAEDTPGAEHTADAETEDEPRPEAQPAVQEVSDLDEEFFKSLDGPAAEPEPQEQERVEVPTPSGLFGRKKPVKN